MINIKRFKARLLNTLLPLIDPNKTEIQLGNECDFNLEQNTPLLTISAFMCEYALAPLSLNYAETILDTKYSIEKIPMEILGAILEKNIEKEINMFSSLINGNISIIEYQNISKASDYESYVDFLLKTEIEIPNIQNESDENVKSIDLPIRLYFKTETSAETFLSKCLENLHPRTNILYNQNLIPFQTIIGIQNFSLSEISSLKTGDAIILADCHINEGKAILTIGDQLFSANLNIQDNTITVDAPITLQHNNGTNMTNENLDISKLNLKMDFILDSQTINVQSLSQIQTGMTINLQNSDLSEITIMVSGQKVGLGRVITIDGKYAVQITNLTSNTDGIQNK